MIPLIVTPLSKEDYMKRVTRTTPGADKFWLVQIMHAQKNAPYRAFAVIKVHNCFAIVILDPNPGIRAFGEIVYSQHSEYPVYLVTDTFERILEYVAGFDFQYDTLNVLNTL